MREGTSAIGIQGHAEYTSLYTVKYVQEDKGIRVAWH